TSGFLPRLPRRLPSRSAGRRRSKMPILDLPPLHLPECGLYLAAVMFHPRAPERHPEFVAAAKNTAMQSVLRKYQPQRIPEELHADVISAATGPRISDRTEADARSLIAPQGEGGSFYPRDLAAGLLLAYVLASASAGEPCSIERAIEVFKTAAGLMPGGIAGR